MLVKLRALQVCTPLLTGLWIHTGIFSVFILCLGHEWALYQGSCVCSRQMLKYSPGWPLTYNLMSSAGVHRLCLNLSLFVLIIDSVNLIVYSLF